MKLQLIIPLLLTILLVACKKEPGFIPDSQISDAPIFKVEGILGDDSLRFIAGEDGGFIKTANEVIDGITHYYGLLSKGDDYIRIDFTEGLLGSQQTLSSFLDNHSISHYMIRAGFIFPQRICQMHLLSVSLLYL